MASLFHTQYHPPHTLTPKRMEIQSPYHMFQPQTVDIQLLPMLPPEPHLDMLHTSLFLPQVEARPTLNQLKP